MDDSTCIEETEQGLVVRARRGDREAFGALYARHAGALYALALRLVDDASLAEDLVQDTFLKALQTLGGYRGEAPLRAWLKRVTTHLAIDRLRARRPAVDLDAVSMASPEPGPESQGAALGLLARIPVPARTVVWLHTMEGWSHAEIGARFGMSESWSKSLVSRALARLRGVLEEDGS